MDKHKTTRSRVITAGLTASIVVSFVFLFVKIILAATNISGTSPNFYAWNDSIGWLDHYAPNTVIVDQYKIAGYASSSAGDISFDCATTRGGNVCGASPFYVINDGAGLLSGWAWNDVYGWMSFCGSAVGSPSCPTSTYSYQVSIDGSGDFSGYAWNDVIGWISFNCNNSPTPYCGTTSHKVNTSWIATSTSATLDSSVFDTGISQGAQLNSFYWEGKLPIATGIQAGFQFAVSNSSSGPWSYMGSDGSSATWFTPAPGVVTILPQYSSYKDYRYFRYRVKLWTDSAQRLSPRVDRVVVNWSP